MNYDFIIIGGGVIGMTTARELAAKGANVALFEQGNLGMEASWAAGGILSSMRPWLENPASARLSEIGKSIYLAFAEGLKDQTGIDPEYYRSGLNIINREHIDNIKQWALISNIAVSQEVEGLVKGIHLPTFAVHLPEIAQVRPPKLIKALKASLKQLRVSIYENTEIENIVIENNRFSHVVFSNDKAYADSAVITAGAWSSILVNRLNAGISIKPVHGQMLCLLPPEKKRFPIILDGDYYLISRQDGHILVGSTMEDIGFKKEQSNKAKQDLFAWATSIWPALKNAQLIKHWSGLRPATDAGRPMIGRVLNIEGLYINSGHFRKGILQAPISARLLAEFLLGESLSVDIELFSPEISEKSKNELINDNESYLNSTLQD